MRRSGGLSILLAVSQSGCLLLGYDGLGGGMGEAGVDASAEAGPSVDGSLNNVDAGGLDGGAQLDPDAGLPADAAAQADADAEGGAWWTQIPPMQSCGLLPTCSQVCEVDQPGCVFECDEALCTPTCEEHSQCHVDCSGSQACNFACHERATCALDCSRKVTPHCSARCEEESQCEIDCSMATACSVECQDGAECIVDCQNATECTDVVCREGAQCQLHCGSSVSCGMTCESGPLRTCPGNVIVCGRDCPT